MSAISLVRSDRAAFEAGARAKGRNKSVSCMNI